MRYIDYGTMQSDAQRRVLEMQRRAQRAVCSQLPNSRNMQDDYAEPHTNPTPCEESAAPLPAETTAKLPRNPEEALITTVLVLLLTENSNIFPILALLYLLI